MTYRTILRKTLFEEPKASSAPLIASQKEFKEPKRELRCKDKALAEAVALWCCQKEALVIRGDLEND